MAAADDIINGNKDGRDGETNHNPANKYYTWGWNEGRRHRQHEIRIDILENRLGIPDTPDEETG